MPTKEIPPWIRDGNPELWVTSRVAARTYFRVTKVTVGRWIRNGTLATLGMPSYWDGHKWFIRLPQQLAPERKKQSA